MLQRIFSAAFLVLGIAFFLPASAGTGSTADTDSPAPFTVQGAPRSIAGGIQQSWRVKVDEGKAFAAVFKGGMWLPNGNGGREYARYSSHILHADGSWTWIGKVPTKFGEQSVVITFGKDAVFGRIPQSDDYPLRLQTEHGVVSLVRTSGAAVSHSAVAAQMRAHTDARAIPRRGNADAKASAQSQIQLKAADVAADADAAADAPAIVVIDVMVAYTPGIVSEYGSQSAALTRINNLIAIANQAYIDSQVNQRIRLVNTVEVNYPDNTSDDSALDDITGYDSNGNPVTIPPSLSQIHALRTQYGADLVSLLRKYDSATNGGCGLSWIIGGNMTPVTPQDNIYGYSVVGDGSDGSTYCLDTSFAHELGHNMGDAHDRANADQPGAYSYSYGFKSTSSTGFATIMAYGDPTQQPLAVFSNPNISICQNQPCGVADSASNSADNAHSMNNTAATIAQFEPKVVGVKPAAHNDINGDGFSDLVFQNPSGYLGWWFMRGTAVLSLNNQSIASGYNVVATGDFDGDGRVDVVWTNSANAIYIWLSNGTSFTSEYVGTYSAGWRIVGAGDVDGDGNADLLFQNSTSNYFGWWLMDGASVLSMHNQVSGAGYRVAGIGDFNGDKRSDVVWTKPDGTVVIWTSTGSAFTGQHIQSYSSGWNLVGAGDVNGDGKADLLFHNPTLNYFGWWLMNGALVSSTHNQVSGAGYSVASTGDFDGNGKTDIVWTKSNAIVIWSSTGSAFTGQHIQSYSAGWSLVP